MIALTKPADAQRNPFPAQIDAAMIVVAHEEQAERKALDELHIADAELSALVRRLREGEEIHTSEGAYIVDRTTGRTIPDNALPRANAKLDEAQGRYQRAAAVASQARGKLNNLQKASEVFTRRAEYWANQAAADATMTPAERERRAMRDAEQRIMAAR